MQKNKYKYTADEAKSKSSTARRKSEKNKTKKIPKKQKEAKMPLARAQNVVVEWHTAINGLLRHTGTHHSQKSKLH